MYSKEITIIGGGLAGSEAAWQAAQRGIKVILWEMKPCRFSPAHNSPNLAELVCSNSFRAESLENAVGLLKEEMRRAGSLFMLAADATRIPAGGALAVDRVKFSSFITAALEQQKNITLIREEVTRLPLQRPLIFASGPLTSPSLSEEITNLIGKNYLYFYDAISPVVEADSINLNIAFRASRYNRGGDDYLNCPLNQEEYYRLVAEIKSAEKVLPRDFEKPIFFEGCLPIEEMADRGKDTLAFGPLKPVGLKDPRTGEQPHAVVQLRPENKERTIYNMVGFQTRLTWPEQKRVFRLIPGLEKANFVRLGSCHRNIFINSPTLLFPTLQLQKETKIFFAGQITGVEGYVESAAMGMVAGINAAHFLLEKPLVIPSPATATGALLNYITTADPDHFQPMNVTYGLFPPLPSEVKKRDRRNFLIQQALKHIEDWRKEILTE
ncbi:MAG TPA: methylenetetrahydrofolate--tRNA-(uracil(54)-C(5))-methyltransferase (FADH(2)-oxidizing) TrmFO [Thermodesulfobacteriota bacterium]|nr:methylenetetrahydrofolate--tRNA-(uracil(54)-C(5))-methyltransferase (FADH(2)-oxidizing) TrmFO [Thermodesulfobacteriota bacterium]